MNFNSNSLFHYTRSLDTIESILQHGFYPNYRIEKFLGHELLIKKDFEELGLDSSKFDIDEIAIPMVSFCDIRLSQIHQHIDRYGEYGIGLSDKWRVRNAVSPIFYLDTRNSSLKYILNSMYISIIQHNAWLMSRRLFETAVDNKSLRYFLLLSLFMKPLTGYEYNMDTKTYNNKEIEFYNEKEWRFVPLINEGTITKTEKQYLIKEDLGLLEEQSKMLRAAYSLKFNLADLEYIILRNESEIEHLTNCISNLNEPESEKMKAYTKIVTVDQIVKDF